MEFGCETTREEKGASRARNFLNVVGIQLFRERLSISAHDNPEGNMGYDQYTVPDTVAVEHTFVDFL